MGVTTSAQDLALAAVPTDGQLTEVVRAEFPRVRRVLLRVLGPRDDVDDLVQTVFVELLRSLPAYRGEGSLGAFVGGITVRVARRAMRRDAWSRRRSTLGEDAVDPPTAAPDGSSPEARTVARRRMAAVRRALSSLPDTKRIAFSLWALEGVSVAEIARWTDASESAVRSRIYQAQQALRRRARRDPVLREALGGASRKEAAR